MSGIETYKKNAGVLWITRMSVLSDHFKSEELNVFSAGGCLKQNESNAEGF